MVDNVVETEEHSGGTPSLPTSDGGASISREEFNVAMNTLKESLATEVKGMFKDLIEGLKLSTTPLEVVRPATIVSEATPDKGEASSGQAPVTKNGSGIFAHSAPPTHYGGPVPTPHLNSIGPPPKFIKKKSD